MTHISIDLETLDTIPSAVVLSCGLVAFDPNTGEILDKQYTRFVKLDEQAARGRTISPSTVYWWARQSEEARRVMTDNEIFGEGTVSGLRNIDTFFGQHDADGVWGNGSDFDNAILGSLFRSFDMRTPWSYGKNRCLRTIKNLKLPKTFIAPIRVGTHHNALDDAEYQANYVSAVCKALSLQF